MSISRGRALPGKVCPARVNRACWVSWCTPAGKLSIRIAVSTVTGRSVLYPNLLQLELNTCYFNCKLRDRFLAGSRGRISGLCYYMLVTLCYATNLHSSNAARRCKMLVFDRLGLPFYSGNSAVQSTDTAPSFDT